MDADHEFAKRKEMRTDEIAALSEAIKILSEDDIREAQQTTFGFLQLGQQRRSQTNDELAKALSRLQKTAPNDAEVLALIEIAKSDPFGKINEAIDKLIAKLKSSKQMK